jgi:hypothetical protein
MQITNMDLGVAKYNLAAAVHTLQVLQSNPEGNGDLIATAEATVEAYRAHRDMLIAQGAK